MITLPRIPYMIKETGIFSFHSASLNLGSSLLSDVSSPHWPDWPVRMERKALLRQLASRFAANTQAIEKDEKLKRLLKLNWKLRSKVDLFLYPLRPINNFLVWHVAMTAAVETKKLIQTWNRISGIWSQNTYYMLNLNDHC